MTDPLKATAPLSDPLVGPFAMGERIGDDMLDAFAVVDDPAKVPGRIIERYGDLLDRVSFYARYDMPDDELAVMLEGFHRA